MLMESNGLMRILATCLCMQAFIDTITLMFVLLYLEQVTLLNNKKLLLDLIPLAQYGCMFH